MNFVVWDFMLRIGNSVQLVNLIKYHKIHHRCQICSLNCCCFRISSSFYVFCHDRDHVRGLRGVLLGLESSQAPPLNLSLFYQVQCTYPQAQRIYPFSFVILPLISRLFLHFHSPRFLHFRILSANYYRIPPIIPIPASYQPIAILNHPFLELGHLSIR